LPRLGRSKKPAPSPSPPRRKLIGKPVTLSAEDIAFCKRYGWRVPKD
jgi:hypothetical protein